MDDTAPDDSLTALLCEALDGDDEVRRMLMVALAMMSSPVISEADRERLRQHGPPAVMQL